MSWQPIETAPRDGTIIIGIYLHIPEHPEYGIVRWCEKWFSDESGSWTDQFADAQWMEPSYWMPLPEPPRGHIPPPIFGDPLLADGTVLQPFPRPEPGT